MTFAQVQKLLPVLPTQPAPYLGCPPTPLRFPRAARTVPGPGQECQTNRLRYGVELLKLQNRNIQKNSVLPGRSTGFDRRAKKNRVLPGRDRARPGPPGPLSKKARVSTPAGPMAGPAAGGPPERGPANRPQPAGEVFFGRRNGGARFSFPSDTNDCGVTACSAKKREDYVATLPGDSNPTRGSPAAFSGSAPRAAQRMLRA